MSNLNPLSWRQKPAGQTPKVWDPFTSLHDEVDRLFSSVNRGGPLGWATPESDFQAPKIDISETENALTIEADLPGLDEDNVEVILADNVLTIRGERKADREEQKKDYHLIERSSASFFPQPEFTVQRQPRSGRCAFFQRRVDHIRSQTPGGAE